MREISGERSLPACAFRQPAEKFLWKNFVGKLPTITAEQPALPRIEDYTRDLLRPLLRVYFTGRRFGSIFVRPVPLFTSMI